MNYCHRFMPGEGGYLLDLLQNVSNFIIRILCVKNMCQRKGKNFFSLSLLFYDIWHFFLFLPLHSLIIFLLLKQLKVVWNFFFKYLVATAFLNNPQSRNYTKAENSIKLWQIFLLHFNCIVASFVFLRKNEKILNTIKCTLKFPFLRNKSNGENFLSFYSFFVHNIPLGDVEFSLYFPSQQKQ